MSRFVSMDESIFNFQNVNDGTIWFPVEKQNVPTCIENEH